MPELERDYAPIWKRFGWSLLGASFYLVPGLLVPVSGLAEWAAWPFVFLPLAGVTLLVDLVSAIHQRRTQAQVRLTEDGVYGHSTLGNENFIKWDEIARVRHWYDRPERPDWHRLSTLVFERPGKTVTLRPETFRDPEALHYVILRHLPEHADVKSLGSPFA